MSCSCEALRLSWQPRPRGLDASINAGTGIPIPPSQAGGPEPRAQASVVPHEGGTADAAMHQPPSLASSLAQGFALGLLFVVLLTALGPPDARALLLAADALVPLACLT